MQHLPEGIPKSRVHGDTSEDAHGREALSLFLLQEGLQRQEQSTQASTDAARQVRTPQSLREQRQQECLIKKQESETRTPPNIR